MIEYGLLKRYQPASLFLSEAMNSLTLFHMSHQKFLYFS
ncbi:hypothetical protein XBKB1_2910011 [Xenorhabdus bovienii str. kraussei Becker Underwood]|nr:hypothetical protein XBKB1_2910011 [Xenorhabdus bovienii str. kraussei Becker Underwood]